MKDKYAVSMFGQKQLSREGGIEIVVKELCTRMARDNFLYLYALCADMVVQRGGNADVKGICRSGGLC